MKKLFGCETQLDNVIRAIQYVEMMIRVYNANQPPNHIWPNEEHPPTLPCYG